MKSLLSCRRLVLTPRDRELLLSLESFRYLSVGQVERLHFRSRQTAERRLRRLMRAGYLEVFATPGSSDRLVRLTDGGARVVSELTARPVAEIWSRKREQPKDAYFLRHFLAAGGFRIGLTEACRDRSDLELAGFIPEYVGKQDQKLGKHVSDSAVGKEGPLIHAPDAVFALKRGEAAALFFVEVDRGTEVLSNDERGVRRMIQFYLAYLASGGYQRYRTDFAVEKEFKGFRVLVVTTTARRIQNMRSATASIPAHPPHAKRLIWLATEEAILNGRILEHPWVSLDLIDGNQYRIAPAMP